MPFFVVPITGTGIDDDPIRPDLPEGIWGHISGWAGNVVDGEYLMFVNITDSLPPSIRNKLEALSDAQVAARAEPHGHDVSRWWAGR